MSKLIPGNQKHLTLNDRLYIEQAINEGRTFKDIAKNLCKDPTTISKEVKAHRLSVWKDHGLFVNMKNRSKKDWVAFICTNPDLSEEEIIRIYGKRWQIEVFFKTCKSYLNLIGECHSLSYDALTAHVAIVFARFMMLALEQRKNEDERTLGELFFFFCDELSDITFCESFRIILKAVFESIYAVFQASDAQMDLFIEEFIKHLPAFLKNALVKGSALS